MPRPDCADIQPLGRIPNILYAKVTTSGVN